MEPHESQPQEGSKAVVVAGLQRQCMEALVEHCDGKPALEDCPSGKEAVWRLGSGMRSRHHAAAFQ